MKSRLKLGLFFVTIFLVIFCITYTIRVRANKVTNLGMSTEALIEYDNNQIKDIKVIIEDKTYDNINELVGVVTEPEVCKVEVSYKNSDITQTFDAYITFNTDKSVKEATYSDGDYFQIILPSIK